MPVTVRLLNKNKWAGITKYPHCYYDLVPYKTKNDRLYTSFNEDDPADVKVMKRFQDKLHTDLNFKSAWWDHFFIRLTDEDLVLFPENDVYDELKVRWLKGHQDAKNGERALNPNAVFLIVDEEEQAKAINERGKIKLQAISELNKMTVDEKRNCLRLYGKDMDSGSAEMVEARLFEYVDENPAKFTRIWIDDKLKYTKVLIERAISKGIISRKGKSLFFGSVPLGYNVDDAAVELEKDDNADIKLGITKGLEG